jgi:hypothetical protein
MWYDIILLCALAWFAVVDAVLALIISNLIIRTRRTESLRELSGSKWLDYEQRLSNIEQARSERTPTALLARVEDLAATVDAIQISNRKFQQRVHGWIGAERSREVRENENVNDVAAPDDEIAAMLALQTAPPARPGS